MSRINRRERSRIAGIAVTAAKSVVSAGATVRKWHISKTGQSVYLKCLIAGRRFTVRVSDHLHDHSHAIPYAVVHVDHNTEATIDALPSFVSYVRRLPPG